MMDGYMYIHIDIDILIKYSLQGSKEGKCWVLVQW